MIFKPFGYISQFVNNKNRKKKLLGDLYEFPDGTMAIGRLDAKSEGLLLLTTDGKLSDTICRGNIEKEYYVQVDGLITETAIEKLRAGVEIGFKGIRYTTKPCVAKRLDQVPLFNAEAPRIRSERHGPTSWIAIVIKEGKFRQVRKMTAAVGFPTLRLVRVRIGKLHLGELKAGEVVQQNELNYN